MVGRKPKSTAQHKQEGTYNATKHRDRLAFPILDEIPNPPKYFTKEQAEKWNHICGMLKRDGMLSDTYLSLVELYCNSWWTWWKAKKDVDLKGLTYISNTGNPHQNPSVQIEKEMMSLQLRVLQDLGYTPRAAMAIKVPGGKDESDPLAELLNGKRVN